MGLLVCRHELFDKLPAELAENAINSFGSKLLKLNAPGVEATKDYARRTPQAGDGCSKHTPVPDNSNHKDILSNKIIAR